MAIADLSHHMSDTFIEGPDATRLLAAVSANNYENFATGQAKQFVPAADDGNIITDGILLRTAEREYIFSGVSAAQEWVKYHAGAGGYDVSCVTDPQSLFRGGADPRLFRYQVQGPLAADVVARAFGGPPPAMKEALLTAGEPLGLGARRRARLPHLGRAKVTLVVDPADAAVAIAPGQELALSNGRYRVESGGELAGMAYHTASLAPANAVLSLAVIDQKYARPGTAVTVTWGEHPGHRTDPDADLGFPRIRATVAPAPYGEHARTSYRAAG